MMASEMWENPPEKYEDVVERIRVQVVGLIAGLKAKDLCRHGSVTVARDLEPKYWLSYSGSFRALNGQLRFNARIHKGQLCGTERGAGRWTPEMVREFASGHCTEVMFGTLEITDEPSINHLQALVHELAIEDTEDDRRRELRELEGRLHDATYVPTPYVEPPKVPWYKRFWQWMNTTPDERSRRRQLERGRD